MSLHITFTFTFTFTAWHTSVTSKRAKLDWWGYIPRAADRRRQNPNEIAADHRTRSYARLAGLPTPQATRNRHATPHETRPAPPTHQTRPPPTHRTETATAHTETAPLHQRKGKDTGAPDNKVRSGRARTTMTLQDGDGDDEEGKEKPTAVQSASAV
ncbi:hypothetical protein MMC16_002739 [Acarospora aff. strigata]|nr:hypothetical protein [Acarospora aff. strigata]